MLLADKHLSHVVWQSMPQQPAFHSLVEQSLQQSRLKLYMLEVVRARNPTPLGSLRMNTALFVPSAHVPACSHCLVPYPSAAAVQAIALVVGFLVIFRSVTIERAKTIAEWGNINSWWSLVVPFGVHCWGRRVQLGGWHAAVQVQQCDLGTTRRRNPVVCVPSRQQDVQCSPAADRGAVPASPQAPRHTP